jgi:predicted enzyme related to lactoylglutathione lyase
MPNPIVRWQIVTPEPAKAAAFYREVFGWELSAANAMGYRELHTGAKSATPVDGGVWPSPPNQPGFVQLFIEVADIDGFVAKATKLGARIIVPKSVLPDGDSMAVLLDPTGIPFGVCRLNGNRPNPKASTDASESA